MVTEQLDQLANTASSQPPGWEEHYGITHPVRAGKLDIRHLAHRDDGVILAEDADMAVMMGDSGWARSTEGPPTFQPGTSGLESNTSTVPGTATATATATQTDRP